MAAFLSDEWFAAVLEAGKALPAAKGLSFDFAIEVPESAAGKVRGHGTIKNGRLTKFAAGKAPSTPDVDFIAKAKRALPIATGEVAPMVAYMRGELKIDGGYELVVDRMVNELDRDAAAAFGAAVAAATDS